ncbi:hypothetical protein [Heyndrickxia sporothermodurans]|uniref:Uncharacterized protein n=3 Tax=Heyndrickxia sporothermodurans TaxID=46224 RepID=A0AB37H9R2_9BACI|nr:hypothetical protein [Heyndrickxia sporothermodurans]MBL5782808.1 hypothetical protein [Heyndrickxia sporothermodurans]MBL5797318.1 hypothetical protein [Heyndrickxia sporothermodurans]MBL5804041.1 hypothetical protein [Heyndrickxia sporothermodurans]MBL5808312.1 hypothetical protein [Heyndrickxia sporothermodurans]MBL5858240.1 hypothetical protein [Heyndrickxia sporothermodurans]
MNNGTFIELEGNKYRQFVMKLLNEDRNELAQKLSGGEDIIKAYFYQPSTNEYISAELDTEKKTLSAGNNTYLIFDKYINGEVQLLHADLQSIQMFKDIENKVQGLLDENIIYDTELFKNMVHKTEFSELLYSPTYNSIQSLYKDFEATNHSIEKIDSLLKSIEEYRDIYNSKEDILNMDIITDRFERNSKVDIYYDSWLEMKGLYEKQSQFQQAALKIGVQDYLADKSNMYKNIDLQVDNIEIAKFLSNTKVEQLTNDKIIPLVFTANENNISDRIGNNMLVHADFDYMNASLKHMELYNPEIGYKNSILEEYIDVNKDRALTNIMLLVNKEMKEIYGERFELFNERDSNDTCHKLFDKLLPIVQNDTFSLYELQKIEPVTKREFEVRDFWDSKNIDMLLEYKNDKNIYFEAKIEDLLFKSRDIEKVIEKVPELVENPNDLSNRTLNRIKEGIEDTKESLYQVKLALATDTDKIKLDPDKEATTEQKIEHNRLMNVLLTTKNLENKIDELEGYVSLVENSKINEKQNQKEMEMER